MIIQSDTTGLELLQQRLEDAINALPGLLVDVAEKVGIDTVQALGSASPKGKSGGGPPPDGDASGPLSDSFMAEAEQQGNAAVLDIGTTQPTKLKFIVEGRGEVRPKTKKALYWKGLPHPVMYARPTQANDFVMPVLDDIGNQADQELQSVVDELTMILEA